MVARALRSRARASRGVVWNAPTRARLRGGAGRSRSSAVGGGRRADRQPPGASGTAYLYRLPGSALTVSDGGRSVPVATGTLTVWGIVHGTDYALGPDILQHGAHLSVVRGGWSLTPPCA